MVPKHKPQAMTSRTGHNGVHHADHKPKILLLKSWPTFALSTKIKYLNSHKSDTKILTL